MNVSQNAEHQQQAERRLRALDAQPLFRELVDRKLKDRCTGYPPSGHPLGTCHERGVRD